MSQPKGREGESFSSPQDQRADIERFCLEQGWEIAEENIFDEMKVSGNALLENRPGLSRAVTAILTGRASVLVGAHSERLWWSHEVRAQVLRLVQEAGGEVWSVDAGRLSSGTAADEFSGEVRTSADRFSRRQNAEKARKAVKRAVARGVCPFPDVPPGLRLDSDNRVVSDQAEIEPVKDAFHARATGATIAEVRAKLRERGIDRSYHGVQSMLANRLYVGEIHFGKLVNLKAHDALIEPDLFEQVQVMRTPRGPKPVSDRLLARLGILRCGSCGARMVVGMQTTKRRKRYAFYRCPPVGDCTERVTIAAHIVEREVIERAKELGRNVKGRASAERESADADLAAERAQADLDAAIRAFAGLEGESAARERIEELTAARDEAVEHAEHLRGLNSALVVTLDNWEHLTLAERRAAIRAKIKAVHVSPGRGVERILVEPRG